MPSAAARRTCPTRRSPPASASPEPISDRAAGPPAPRRGGLPDGRRSPCHRRAAEAHRREEERSRGGRHGGPTAQEPRCQLPRLPASSPGRGRQAAPLRQHLPERRGHPLPRQARYAAQGWRRRLHPAGAGGRRVNRRRWGLERENRNWKIGNRNEGKTSPISYFLHPIFQACPPDLRMSTVPAAGRLPMLYANILDAIGNTPLVELPHTSPNPNVTIYAKLEGQNPSGSVKDRCAKYMIDAAERDGLLSPDKIILEPTSGNTGIALAMIGRVKGYQVMVVIPESVSEERSQLLRAYGAEIVYSDGARGTNGSIAVAQQMVAEAPQRFYMPYQYGNEANPRAHYETTGPEIARDLPDVDAFVAGLGTGGTLTGTGRYLKEYNPKIKIIAAVPHPGDLVQGLRSLEEGFIPPVLDESVLDGRIVVDSRSSFAATKELAQKEGIFAGISCGAAVKTAQRLAARMERGKIAVILADGGWKYLSTDLWTTDYEDLPDDLDNKTWW